MSLNERSSDKPLSAVQNAAIAASQTATTGGRKFDAGKLLYGLLPPLALEENVKVLTFGAQKYEPDNWRRVPDGVNRYFDAAQRHIWAWKKGQIHDPETGLHHMAHAICCLQFIADLELASIADLNRQIDIARNIIGTSDPQDGSGPG
jgi:hypothetical protein